MTNLLWQDSSSYISIKNELNQTLFLSDRLTPGGYWKINPFATINPNQTIVFHLKSDIVEYGLRGAVTYKIDNNTGFNFKFANSALYGGYAGLNITGPAQSNYSYIITCKLGGIGQNCLGGSIADGCSIIGGGPVCVEYIIKSSYEPGVYTLIFNNMNQDLSVTPPTGSITFYYYQSLTTTSRDSRAPIPSGKGGKNIGVKGDSHSAELQVTYNNSAGITVKIDALNGNTNVASLQVLGDYSQAYAYYYRCKVAAANDIPASCYKDYGFNFGSCPPSGGPLCVWYNITKISGNFDTNVMIQQSIQSRATDIPANARSNCALESESIIYGDWVSTPPNNIAENTFSKSFTVTGIHDVRGSGARITYRCSEAQSLPGHFDGFAWATNVSLVFTNTFLGQNFRQPQVTITPYDTEDWYYAGLSYSVECKSASYWSSANCIQRDIGLDMRFVLSNQPLPRTTSLHEVKQLQNLSRVSGLDGTLMILAEPSQLYTTLSWAFGNTSKFIMTGERMSWYTAELRNFVQTDDLDPKVILKLYADDNDNIDFASLKITDDYFPAGQWTSKLYAGPVVTHREYQLKIDYSSVAYFKAQTSNVIGDNMVKSSKQYFSQSQEDYVNHKLDAVPLVIKDAFPLLYQKWSVECMKLLKSSSNPYKCKNLPGVKALQDLGDESTPLYIKKLMYPDVLPLAVVPYSVVHEVDYKFFLYDANESALTEMKLQAIRAVELWLDEQHVL